MFGHDFPYLDTRDINLDWLLKNMKTLVQDWTEYQLSMNQQFSNLTQAFDALKDWVENYFEELDVSAEIEQKLDRMAVSGELGFIMRPIISGEVSDWLAEHITQPTVPAIDNSLTVSGAAADAKVTGDNIRAINSHLLEFLALDSDDAVIVPADSDLDDYTTPGNYKIPTMAIAETIDHIPYQTSGRLTVATTTQTANVLQVFWANSAQQIAIYTRMRLSGTFSNWMMLPNELYISNLLSLATVRDFYPRSANAVHFTKSGNNIITTLPAGLAHYLSPTGAMTERTYPGGVEFTVPHDSFAIYNIDERTIEVKSVTQLAGITGVNYIPLFYNSYGNVRGLFEKYAILDKISKDPEVFFYGENTYPKFQVLSDKSINVTIPANARVNLVSITSSPEIFRNGVSTQITAQTINVPHDKCLVYDYATQNISIENYSFPFSQDKAVLFYNSSGAVNGEWYRYYLKQKQEEAAAGYPFYFNDLIVSKADEINLLLSADDASGIIFITDHHYPNNRFLSVGVSKAISDQCNIDKIFLGGDYINRETAKADALRQVNNVASKYMFPDTKTFRIVGNHDFNNPAGSTDPTIVANQVTSAELRNAILSRSYGDIVYDEDSLSYYYDDEYNKIRYFVGSVNYLSQDDTNSIKWVADELQNVPTGYSVVVFWHTILTYSNGVTSLTGTGQTVAEVLDAFKNKTTYTIGADTYDYSSITADLICAICGDMHVDTDFTTTGGVQIIATTTDSMQEDGGLTRELGQTSEIAFDVFVFDKGTDTIYVKRIGAGTDRQYSY